MRYIHFLVLSFLMYGCSDTIKTDNLKQTEAISKIQSDIYKVINHQITLSLHPSTHTLKAIDVITFPTPQNNWDFLLHNDLKLTLNSTTMSLKHISQNKTSNTNLYHVESQSPFDSVTIEYSGQIYHSIQQQSEEYEKSFSETPGIIDSQGVFLSQSSYWYPVTKNALVSFKLDISLPSNWNAVSQGALHLHKGLPDSTHVVWEERQAQDEIYIIAGKFHTYEKISGSVKAMVYLREPDNSLAQKYLTTTVQYIEMYRQLIGPYPYAKFALVENFWETGYGMPSFTLLGPKVIRFPFIMHSSYPHEILHNWWGNGVFVEYKKGNWSEGLTSYLADHLIQEQRGFGTNYRRNTLQKYTNYVDKDRDLSLLNFTSRHSSATEAVGYGKTMMLFHMLRMELGDPLFIDALQTFFKEFKFQYATFDDIEKVFSAISDKNFKQFFKQWVQRTGAPNIKIKDARISKIDNEYNLHVKLLQLNDDDAYDINIPVAINLKNNKQTIRKSIHMDKKTTEFSIQLPDEPNSVEIDPEFDVFRKLDINEIPPALSRSFGAQNILIVLPSSAPSDIRDNYMQLAKTWQNSQQRNLKIVYDDKLETIPNEYSVWLFGWNNKLLESFKQSLKGYGAKVHKNGLKLNSKEFSQQQHAIVLTTRNAKNPENAITWLAVNNIKSMHNLGRKLPHYGKYSYLVFEGDQANNIFKGQWPVINSPMKVFFTQSSSADILEQSNTRTALAELPPVFSQQAMMADIEFLCRPEMEGRGIDSRGLIEAATYIANEFKKAGLEPGGNSNSGYFQTWKQKTGPNNSLIQLKNVIGVLPGKNNLFNDQSVIVSAHYDHLGKGWPDVHTQDKGKVHYGADDNASGVAVMLEMARVFAQNGKPDRTIIFVAFTGEEVDRIGSRYFVTNYKKYPIQKIIGVLNLDTVGRLNNNNLLIFGTGSAHEWIHIFRGAGFVTGISVQSVQTDIGSSDQKSFTDVGIPAVQFFSGTHTDFHRPGDRVEKIDGEGLVKVASILNEALDYLSTRPQMLTSALPSSNQLTHTQAPKVDNLNKRKVSLGTIPDYTYPGPGVKITGTAPDSPAQKIGLIEEDIILSIDGESIRDLREFAKILKRLKPNHEIELQYLRNNVSKKIKVRLIER